MEEIAKNRTDKTKQKNHKKRGLIRLARWIKNQQNCTPKVPQPKIINFVFGNKKTDNLVSAFILSLFCNFENRGG